MFQDFIKVSEEVYYYIEEDKEGQTVEERGEKVLYYIFVQYAHRALSTFRYLFEQDYPQEGKYGIGYVHP